MGNGFDVEFTFEETHGLIERLDGVGGDSVHERSFLGGDGRQEDAAFAELFGEAGEGEGAAHGSRGTGETEFAGDQVVVDLRGLHLIGGEQDAEGDGQVVERAFFAQVAGGEVDGRAGARDFESAVAQCGDDAVVGFFDGGVGQADKDELRVAALAGVDLNVNQLGIDALQCGGGKRRKHGLSGGGEGLAARDHAQVVLNRVYVGVAAVGAVEKTVNAGKIFFEFGFHDFRPKHTGSRDELCG